MSFPVSQHYFLPERLHRQLCCYAQDCIHIADIGNVGIVYAATHVHAVSAHTKVCITIEKAAAEIERIYAILCINIPIIHRTINIYRSIAP